MRLLTLVTTKQSVFRQLSLKCFTFILWPYRLVIVVPYLHDFAGVGWPWAGGVLSYCCPRGGGTSGGKKLHRIWNSKRNCKCGERRPCCGRPHAIQSNHGNWRTSFCGGRITHAPMTDSAGQNEKSDGVRPSDVGSFYPGKILSALLERSVPFSLNWIKVGTKRVAG